MSKLNVIRILVAVGMLVPHLWGSPALAQQEDQSERKLTRYFSLPTASIVGTVVKENEDAITLFDIATNKEVVCQKDQHTKVEHDISLEDAIKYAGLPAVASWKISQLRAKEKPRGMIAGVQQSIIYITLGEVEGIDKGQNVFVYRKEKEVVNPATGEVLGIERAKLAKLEVVEVHEKYSKAKILGDLEIKLEVGDEVEPDHQPLTVAVCPLLNEDGNLTTTGLTLSENLTTSLVQHEIPVVERSALAPVLTELLVQNTRLFDQDSAQKIGKLTGANLVLTGKIVPDRRQSNVFLRLVEVKTGEILFALSSPINLSQARLVQPGDGPNGIFLVVPSNQEGESSEDDSPMVEIQPPRTEHFRMMDRRKWEDSRVAVKQGQRIRITAPNDRIDYKNHYDVHGVSAPIGSLLVRIDHHVIDIGTGKSLTAPADGNLLFRSNLKKSPNHTMLITIEITP